MHSLSDWVPILTCRGCLSLISCTSLNLGYGRLCLHTLFTFSMQQHQREDWLLFQTKGSVNSHHYAIMWAYNKILLQIFLNTLIQLGYP